MIRGRLEYDRRVLNNAQKKEDTYTWVAFLVSPEKNVADMRHHTRRETCLSSFAQEYTENAGAKAVLNSFPLPNV